MKPFTPIRLTVLLFGLAWLSLSSQALALSASEDTEAAPEEGSHGGRLLRDGDFALEVTIFETGVPPEFRIWALDEDEIINPEDVSLRVELTRLGGKKNVIDFSPQEDFLRGDAVVYEPHSFVVNAVAQYAGETHEWSYDNFEGRTTIRTDVAETMGIETEEAGSAVLKDTIHVFGILDVPVDARRQISARFDGLVKVVHVNAGDPVAKGDSLITIESNDSLKSYTITSPMAGIAESRFVNAGEQAGKEPLLTLLDDTKVVAMLSVFPQNRAQLRKGQPVTVDIDGITVTGEIDWIAPALQANQTTLVRVALDDSDEKLAPGAFVEAEIEVSEYEVPLAVKRSGLQSFRDFTVVYARVGNDYEVRMLDLGREVGEWVEVLGGLEPGTEYVTENSYILKADVEKSGASHDH